MPTSVGELEAGPAAPERVAPAVGLRPSARPLDTTWTATSQTREQVWARLTAAPFATDSPNGQRRIRTGLRLLLDWLEGQPGDTWQDRWLASGVDTAGRAWRQGPSAWLVDHGHHAQWRHKITVRAVALAVSADVIRPSLAWLVTAGLRRETLEEDLASCRDPDGFAHLRRLCSTDPDVSPAAAHRTTRRAAVIVAAKGGTLNDITTGDVLELLDVEAQLLGTSVGATHLFYRTLHTMGVFEADAPTTLRQLRSSGQRTPRADDRSVRVGVPAHP